MEKKINDSIRMATVDLKAKYRWKHSLALNEESISMVKGSDFYKEEVEFIGDEFISEYTYTLQALCEEELKDAKTQSPSL